MISTFTKNFEKIVHFNLTDFLNKNNIITSDQYSFKKDTSTEMAILDLNQYVLSKIESKLLTIGVFIDISKAFDSIRHDLLLRKLYHYGIRGQMYDWCYSYLNGRQQYITINSSESLLLATTSGVPQGSILGPSFFNLFINYIVNFSKIHHICRRHYFFSVW